MVKIDFEKSHFGNFKYVPGAMSIQKIQNFSFMIFILLKKIQLILRPRVKNCITHLKIIIIKTLILTWSMILIKMLFLWRLSLYPLLRLSRSRTTSRTQKRTGSGQKFLQTMENCTLFCYLELYNWTCNIKDKQDLQSNSKIKNKLSHQD